MIAEVRNLILRARLSPGDIVMLTAAVRDLHRCYPGKFITDVRTPFPELWLGNPYITALAEQDPAVEIIDCDYTSIHQSNVIPQHFLHGYIDDLNKQLELEVRLTEGRGDIHLLNEETQETGWIEWMIGEDVPYWLVSAGGKFDCSVKWWHYRRFQDVVDALRGRVLFVQVGGNGHYHPPLEGVIDLRGKTDLRELIQLVYRATGILCPITALMHLAPAVAMPPGKAMERACVVVAGGREPPSWVAYPTHQFLHTVGMLPCCGGGGCWKSRTFPLNDGDGRDAPADLCSDVVQDMPHCMHIIQTEDVIKAILDYHRHPQRSFATNLQWKAAIPYLSPQRFGRQSNENAFAGNHGNRARPTTGTLLQSHQYHLAK